MATEVSKTKWADVVPPESLVDSASVDDVLAGDTSICIHYVGKQGESQILASPSPVQFATLYESPGSFDRLYYGDNFSVLTTLLHDPTVRGKVRLVYIDPPFATGSVFQSRSQDDAYTDLLSGSRYVEFLRKRLIVLRELLAPDGSIYVHLDSNMAFAIKLVMDEVFGERNFRNFITRKKCNPKNYTRKTYGNISDYILFYTKSDQYVWHRPYEAWTQAQIEKEYSYIENETGRRYKKVPIHAPGTRQGKTGGLWHEMLPPPGKHWQYTPETLDAMDARGEIYWSPTGNPRRKIYADESSGKPVQDIWLNFRDAHNQNIEITGYPTEKNQDLLAQVITASSDPGDIVLDCFAGSGTTLAVAGKFGRKWIGVDNSVEAIATILKRFAVGTHPMGDFVSQNAQSDAAKVQAALFDLDALIADSSPEVVSRTVPPVTPFQDFVLLSQADKAADLQDLLCEWQKWLEG